MGDIVNLGNWRKRQTKVEAEVVAAQNRLIYGQSKREKVRLKADAAKLTKHLDGHHIESCADDVT